jgi:hypothetical protein
MIPVRVSVRVTSAAGTTALEESVTVPEMEAWGWAGSNAENRMSETATLRSIGLAGV